MDLDIRSREFWHICAPMVRYSKLAFRKLVRRYGVDLAFTPMIMADAFVRAEKARDVDLTTDDEVDRPLIVQFAANAVDDFVGASQLVSNEAQGSDLNCGCPQRWAWQEGIGACLIHDPQLIHDLVRQTRNQVRDGFLVSVKIRIHGDDKETVDLARKIEAAGTAFLTVHGRTRKQRSEPVNVKVVKEIKDSLNIPVFYNGDIRSLADAERARLATGVDGVMSARGMLENPAMFAGYDETPAECVVDWVRIAAETGTAFPCFHHHLSYMCSGHMSRNERKIFNTLSSYPAVVDFLRDKLDLEI